MENNSEKLISLLSEEKRVFIQTHDFPDPDAIAAAFGLQYFLKARGIAATLCYEGELQTNPVESMVKDLGITMKKVEEANIKEEDKIILIDGCKGNENITSQKGKIVAVIDHHQGRAPDDVPFVDVRPDHGSCATIVSTYLQEQKIELSSQVATALAIGIHVDTSSFRRRTHPQDIESFSFLYTKVDQQLLSAVLRNNVVQEELLVYEKALRSIRIDKKFAFYHCPDECSQNLLGILADFFLSIEEIEFVALCAHSQGKIIFSVRSENPEWNAAFIIKAVLKGFGSGGGHKDMAGGAIKDLTRFDEENIYERFKERLKENRARRQTT